MSRGWTYGLADVWPDEIRKATRVANPGCYPSASLAAIAPLLHAGIVSPHPPIIIDAKSGVSGAGRGGESKFGFADVNEDVTAYGLVKHAHVPEIAATIRRLQPDTEQRLCFTPHLIPMTRGILATCYLAGEATTEQCLSIAREFYKDRPFVRVVDQSPHTKWATGSNLVFVSYAANASRTIVALGAIDNLGKGAAGQAVAECEPDARAPRDHWPHAPASVAVRSRSVEVSLESAVANFRAGRFAEATIQYRELLQKEPANATALLHLGMLRFQDRAFDESISLLRRSIDIGAEDSGQLLHLGTCALQHRPKSRPLSRRCGPR